MEGTQLPQVPFAVTLTLENLNTWLTANGGYVSGNLLVWDSVSKLGQLQIIKYGSDIPSPELKKFIQQCYPVVAFVENRHWILVNGNALKLELISGYDQSEVNTFYVNNPGSDQNRYEFREFGKLAVYSPKRGAELLAEIDSDLDLNAYQSEFLMS